ncbi:MAG TPA: PAS domain S-box protein, partial [Thermoplasmatales archaeon]|nr:PAS domain S-box protein [Thermoplasmatales archaeon]
RSEKITGYGRNEVLHKKIWDTIIPSDYAEQWRNYSDAVFSQKAIELFEIPIVTKKGEKFPIVWKAMPVADKSVKDICTIGIEKSKRKKLVRFAKKLEKHTSDSIGSNTSNLQAKPEVKDNERVPVFEELKNILLKEKELIDDQWKKLRKYADALEKLNKTLLQEKERIIKDKSDLQEQKKRFSRVFQQEINKFDREIEQRKQRLQKLQEQEQAFKQLQQKIKDIEQMRISLEKLAAELEERKYLLEKMNTTVEQEKKKVEMRGEEIKRLENTIREKEKHLLKKEEMLRKNRRELETKERELTNLRIKLEREQRELEQRLQKSESEFRDRDKLHLEREIARLKQKMEKLLNREKEFKEQLRKAKVKERQLKRRILQNEGKIQHLEELEKQLGEERSLRSRLQNELAVKNQIIKQFEERENELVSKRQDLERREKLIEELEKDLIEKEEYLNQLAIQLSKEDVNAGEQTTRWLEQPMEDTAGVLEKSDRISSESDKDVDERLSISAVDLSSLPESSPAVVVQKGMIQEVTSAFATLVGYEKGELTNKNFFSLIPPEQLVAVREYYLNRLKGRDVNSYDTILLTKEEETLPVKVTLNPITWNGEKADLITIERKDE